MSSTNISLDGSRRNTRDGHQKSSVPTSESYGAQKIRQEQQSTSGGSMTAATGAGEMCVCC